MTTTEPSKSYEDLLREEIYVEQQIERLDCLNDPQLFIERYTRIPRGRDLVPFKLWPKQVEALRAIHEDKRLIVLKARQLGFSWLMVAYALWMAVFHERTAIAIASQTGDDAKLTLKRVKEMHRDIAEDSTRAFILGGKGIGEDSANNFQIGSSLIRSLVSTGYSFRGGTYGLIVLDEAGYMENARDIWQAANPAAEHGRIAAISTGNGTTGTGEEFYNQWAKAQEGRSAFKPIFTPWYADPARDEEWKLQRQREFAAAPDRFFVEYPETPDQAFMRPDADLIYPTDGIEAAVRLGAEYDKLIEQGQMHPPVGYRIAVGWDPGEASHALPIWELEGRGVYIPPLEVVTTHASAVDIAKRILAMVNRLGYPFSELRYDAAMPEYVRGFLTLTRGWENAPATRSNNFGAKSKGFDSLKHAVIDYVRVLFNNAAQGQRLRTIAISPKNEELIRQLRALEWDDIEANKVRKVDDHGPDALLCGVRPIADAARAQLDLR